MMNSFNYTTVPGDRLDVLAYRFYGSMAGISILADANPEVPITAVFPHGTVLIVPVLDDTVIETKTNLPPWKR